MGRKPKQPYELTVQDAEYLNKIQELMKEFHELTWQYYKEKGSCFTSVSNLGGSIMSATIHLSFQQHRDADVDIPLLPATLGFSIGNYDSALMFLIDNFPQDSGQLNPVSTLDIKEKKQKRYFSFATGNVETHKELL